MTTDATMDLQRRLEKSTDTDFLREMIGFTAHRLMELEVESLAGAAYGPATTIYNRFNRWSRAGIWQRMAERRVVHDALDVQCIDSTTAKAHLCSAGGKGGPTNRRSAAAVGGDPLKSTPSSTMKADCSPLN